MKKQKVVVRVNGEDRVFLFDENIDPAIVIQDAKTLALADEDLGTEHQGVWWYPPSET